MEFITDYNLTGLLLGLCSFLIIGLFHPLVVKGEYYLGVRCWWGFLLLGIAACVCSVLADGFFVQTLLGVLAFFVVLEHSGGFRAARAGEERVVPGQPQEAD